MSDTCPSIKLKKIQILAFFFKNARYYTVRSCARHKINLANQLCREKETTGDHQSQNMHKTSHQFNFTFSCNKTFLTIVREILYINACILLSLNQIYFRFCLFSNIAGTVPLPYQDWCGFF